MKHILIISLCLFASMFLFIDVYAGSCVYFLNGFWSGDTLYNRGYTISIVDDIAIVYENNCPCFSSIYVTRNGQPFTNHIPFTINDTGTYIITRYMDPGVICSGARPYIDTVHVRYKPLTSVNEINNKNIFQLT